MSSRFSQFGRVGTHKLISCCSNPRKLPAFRIQTLKWKNLKENGEEFRRARKVIAEDVYKAIVCLRKFWGVQKEKDNLANFGGEKCKQFG